jgi:hypothetical protein
MIKDESDQQFYVFSHVLNNIGFSFEREAHKNEIRFVTYACQDRSLCISSSTDKLTPKYEKCVFTYCNYSNCKATGDLVPKRQLLAGTYST